MIITNQKQVMVFKVAMIQILIALLLVFILSRCSNRDNSASAVSKTAIAKPLKDSTPVNKAGIDPDYIPIAAHYSPEIKQKLKDLELLKFENGTIGDQILNYLKKGDQDFGDDFKFIDLRFERRDANMNEKFAHEIKDLAAIMRSFPDMKIKMMVYTDNVGGEKANQILSENRANEVKGRLVAAGIKEDRIITKAYGQNYPVGDNKTYDGQLINNRIEIKILSK